MRPLSLPHQTVRSSPIKKYPQLEVDVLLACDEVPTHDNWVKLKIRVFKVLGLTDVLQSVAVH